MLVLTLKRPWPWAIFSLPEGKAKRVENRTWSPPAHAVGELIAIHAGNGWDHGACEFIRHAGGKWPPPKAEHPSGVIVGIARLAGVRLPSPPKRGDDPWYMGAHGWLLADVAALREPVAHQGRLGLRRLPADVEALVRAALTEAA